MSRDLVVDPEDRNSGDCGCMIYRPARTDTAHAHLAAKARLFSRFVVECAGRQARELSRTVEGGMTCNSALCPGGPLNLPNSVPLVA